MFFCKPIHNTLLIYYQNPKLMKTKLLFLLALGLSSTSMALGEPRIVKGQVLSDSDGEPMIGVAISEKGTTNGTITDADGNFSINVQDGAVLTISYMGYTTQNIKPEGMQPIKIELVEDNKMLDDVVVIGYGTQRKSDLTGSVAQIKSDDLKHRSITDAAAALQGKAAGLQISSASGKPGEGASIRVRGLSTNSESTGPLLIVDGLQVSSIQYLDPSLIESIEVLKDAASAAIYGVAAGNGVILITTKSGKKNGKGTITYEAKFFNQQLGHVPSLLNASQFKDWMSMQLGSAKVEKDMADATNQYGWDPNTDTDWLSEYFENTWAVQHSVTAQGGNDRGSYFLSLNYLNQDGIVKGSKDKYERLHAQINADYKIKDWLQIGTNTSIEKWRSQGVSQNGYGSSFEMLLLIDPLTPLYWTEPSQMLGTFRDHYTKGINPNTGKYEGRYTLFGDENGYYATSYFNQRLAGGNPFSQRDRSEEKKDGVNVQGTAFVNITPIKSVTFTSRLGYNISYDNSRNWQYPYFLNDQTHGDNYTIDGHSGNSINYRWENFANYNETFAEKHNVSAMVGMAFHQYNANYTNGGATGDDVLKWYADNYLFLNSVNGKPSTTKSVAGVTSTSRDMSYFGRLIYNYADRYGAQFNFRADAFDSSKLPENSRWGKFFSASAGWTFSNEEFFKNLVPEEIVSFGKLRLSWGQNGNINSLGNGFGYRAVINYNGTWYQFGEGKEATYGSKPNIFPNPDLKWETSEQVNIGADIRFLSDRLTLGLDWYKKTTSDQIVNVSILPEWGFDTMASNAGEVVNKGLEIELSWKDRIGDVNYSISGNLATLDNEVTYLDPSTQRVAGGTVDGASPGSITCYFEKGEPIWYMRGYKYKGRNEDGRAVYYDANGNETLDPQEGDMTNIGSGLPTLTYGVTLSADWKGIDFSIFGAGEAGKDIYYGLYRTGYNNIAKGIYDDFKSKKLPDADKVAGSKQFWTSSAAVYNGSFFKIKQIQLGYTLPKKISTKAYMQNVRAYVSLDDFFTFTKYPGLDPEAVNAGYNCPGIDKGAYPNMKKVVVGCSVTF